MDDTRKAVFHPGEREAQRRFGGAVGNGDALGDMIRDDISPRWAGFLEGQAFFFIATANDEGQCDCSFRGREFDASGRPYPLLKVLDARTLVFPDYSGNNLYNSLGNILVNPNIGMLFVDFENRRRMRVNGTATIVEGREAYAELWPLALRYVKVGVVQAYPNCRARIPRMTFAPVTDAFFDE